jgi:O-methyltransferase involved in polyketide biosynthesis
MSRWDTISITAHYTAQEWVRQGLPCAEQFNTTTGRLLYALARPFFSSASRLGVTTPHEFLVQRHLLLDRLLELVKPAQVVELACGLSPRCLAYSQKLGVPCLDVDLPAMVRVKKKQLRTRVPERYRLAALDLIASADYMRDLGELLEREPPTVVIAEGLLIYFSLEQQQQIFNRVAAMLCACGGGVFLTDVHHQDEVDKTHLMGKGFRWFLHRFSRTSMNEMIANFDEGQAMLQRAGFTQVTGHRPATWSEALGLPIKALDSGLCIYEARIDVKG